MNRAETRTGLDSARGVECERGFLEGYDIIAALNGHHGRKKLGPYEILAPIGAGGMGELYKASDTRLNPIPKPKGLRLVFA